jgi:hypothetical protein
MKKSYYYLYLIQFNDGRYYIGSRKCKCKPERDTKYMGSPVTYKELWSDPNLSKIKYILKEVDSVNELKRIEPILIKAGWERDGRDLCLNRHASPTFHPEVCSKGGKISGKNSYELGRGIFGLSKEQQLENCKKGAKITSERYAREFAVISPKGEVFKGRNLTRFCDEHGLDVANVRRVLRGTQSYYKGWIQYDQNKVNVFNFL